MDDGSKNCLKNTVMVSNNKTRSLNINEFCFIKFNG